MAKITEAAFWINLAKKIFRAFLKERGFEEKGNSKNYHVVPFEEGLAVKKEGNQRYTSKHRKQSTAIRKAKTLARKLKGDVIIHRSDGSIRDRINLN